MIKLLIKIAIPIIIGILIYNYFFGTVKEKETSVEVYSKVKDLSLSLVDVMRSEKEKFDEGKYDKAMDKLNDVYDAARNHEEDMTTSEKKELRNLESEKEDLKKDIEKASKLDQKEADKESKSLNDRLYDLVKRTENLLGKE
jgi:Ran GTPase-activating protein (RanGAP) involved in mRNA processing and transport